MRSEYTPHANMHEGVMVRDGNLVTCECGDTARLPARELEDGDGVQCTRCGCRCLIRDMKPPTATAEQEAT